MHPDLGISERAMQVGGRVGRKVGWDEVGWVAVSRAEQAVPPQPGRPRPVLAPANCPGGIQPRPSLGFLYVYVDIKFCCAVLCCTMLCCAMLCCAVCVCVAMPTAQVMHSLVADLFGRLAGEASSLVRHSKRSTLGSREVQVRRSGRFRGQPPPAAAGTSLHAMPCRRTEAH